VHSFKTFLLIGALFLVVLVPLYVVPDGCLSRRIVVRCFEDEEIQGKQELKKEQ
jgi:hypothetical protein